MDIRHCITILFHLQGATFEAQAASLRTLKSDCGFYMCKTCTNHYMYYGKFWHKGFPSRQTGSCRKPRKMTALPIFLCVRGFCDDESGTERKRNYDCQLLGDFFDGLLISLVWLCICEICESGVCVLCVCHIMIDETFLWLVWFILARSALFVELSWIFQKIRGCAL
jgi:hypothetical protein